MDTEVAPAVIELSSALWKAGFGGDDAPRAVYAFLLIGIEKNPMGNFDFTIFNY